MRIHNSSGCDSVSSSLVPILRLTLRTLCLFVSTSLRVSILDQVASLSTRVTGAMLGRWSCSNCRSGWKKCSKRASPLSRWLDDALALDSPFFLSCRLRLPLSSLLLLPLLPLKHRRVQDRFLFCMLSCEALYSWDQIKDTYLFAFLLILS